MPKLKGLLDSANAKLAGLLGDFPQGFNAGAVAGFPGWAGDMAYLADTARLALTGADSQAAPEDYVGTTDYIAKQAGYPVPQTLSGQLGAAVGGLMSPGPGDLAKFAPLGAMFLGAKAKTAMPDVLEYAQAMEKAGKSADEIWQTTAKLGQPWFKGADGKWRFEIDDSTASLIPSAFDNKFGDVRAEAPDALVHPDLWNAYSAEDIAAGGITLYPQSGSIAGQYSDGLVQVGTDAETFGAIASGKPLTYELTGETSTGLHELQHGVQQAEGFGRGGHWAQAFRDPRIWGKRGAEGSDIARKMLADKLAELQQVMSLDDYAKAAWQSDVVTPEIAADYARNYAPTVTKGVSPEVAKAAQETVAKDWYKRLAGEAEARNVQARMNMSMDERIALPPWVTQDVPTEQQIVRFGDGPAMAIEDFAARRAGKAKPYKEAINGM